ncbi:MAG: hypothetical protein GX933_09700 [Chloroflexi bacterium]|nr:hypothetical protein [Chloroflexota bacterium]
MKTKENIEFAENTLSNLTRLTVADNQVNVVNSLFDLFIQRIEAWVNGKSVEAGIEDIKIPFNWRQGQEFTLRFNQPVNSADLVKVFFFDSQIGPLVFTNEIKPVPVPTADHRQSIFQFFRSDFQVDLLLDARKVLGKATKQKRGVAFYPFTTSQDISHFLKNREQLLAPSLRSVKPDLLGIAFTDPVDQEMLQSFCGLCTELQCIPVFHFHSTNNQGIISSTLRTAAALLQPDEQQPEMIVSFQADNADTIVQQFCESLLSSFSGLTIFLNDPSLFRLTNQPANSLHTLINSGRVIPTLSRIEPGPSAWFEADKAQEKDFASALVHGFDQYLKKIRAILQANHLDDTVRIAINPWSFFRAPTKEGGYSVNLSAQDAFYYAGMVNRLLRNSNLVSHALVGPLIGDAGLLRLENDQVYPSAVFPFFQLMQDIEENILAFEMLPNRPVPEYFWSGIKGAMEAVELPIVEGFASRSNDGSKVFLNVVNRSPRKRAVIRISFINFEDMRPLKAGVIRRNRKQDRNYPDKVNNVTFAEISVRKYRRMDHVNLDIPASGIASMVLTSEP